MFSQHNSTLTSKKKHPDTLQSTKCSSGVERFDEESEPSTSPWMDARYNPKKERYIIHPTKTWPGKNSVLDRRSDDKWREPEKGGPSTDRVSSNTASNPKRSATMPLQPISTLPRTSSHPSRRHSTSKGSASQYSNTNPFNILRDLDGDEGNSDTEGNNTEEE